MRKIRHEISEKRKEIRTLRTVTEQIRELPVDERCYSVLCCKECGTEILTSGQMEVGKMHYEKRKTNTEGSQYGKRLRKIVCKSEYSVNKGKGAAITETAASCAVAAQFIKVYLCGSRNPVRNHV